jgi:hypothetical protein
LTRSGSMAMRLEEMVREVATAAVAMVARA